MNDVWWYLSRSSGVVATVLIVAALVQGLFFSARATGTRHRPAWWLSLHNYLGGLAFAFTILHVATVYQDELSGIGLLQIFVPLTANGWEWGITWGVVATYIFALVVFTSWPKKRGSRRTWLMIHLLSVPATVLVATHAWMVGSSRGQLWFQALLALLVGLVVYPAVLRVMSALAKRSSRRPGAQTPETNDVPTELKPANSVPVSVPGEPLIGSGTR